LSTVMRETVGTRGRTTKAPGSLPGPSSTGAMNYPHLHPTGRSSEHVLSAVHRADQPIVVVVERGHPGEHLPLLHLREAGPVRGVMRREIRISRRDRSRDG